jgi:glycosyltransferase 2 family protein
VTWRHTQVQCRNRKQQPGDNIHVILKVTFPYVTMSAGRKRRATSGNRPNHRSCGARQVNLRRTAVISVLAGLVLALALLIHFGLSEVGAALRAAGASGLIAISMLHLVAIAVMGLAWWAVAGGRDAPAGPLTFIWGRVMRDCGSEVLPLSQVGGYVLGARAIALHGIRPIVAAATTVVDVTLDLGAQLTYTGLGLGLLLQLPIGAQFALPGLIGLAIAVAAIGGFVLAQVRGARILDRFSVKLARDWLGTIAATAEALQREIRRAYVRRSAAWICFLLHFAAWVGAASEMWLVLQLMGAPLGFGSILIIESLLYGIRSVAFAVPNAIGVQEGAYVVLGTAFGLTPDVALALSLLKRGRDLLIGIPALLAWQFVEGRRFFNKPITEQANPTVPATD